MTPAQKHAQYAGVFTDRVLGVSANGWDAPAPVAGWAARDVVRHLVEWFPAFLESGAGIVLDKGPSADVDPVKAWQVHADAVQALLDDPSTADQVLSNPHFGEVGLPQAIDQFYTPDIFMHTWDLARATGQDERLDEDIAREMYEGMQPIDEMLRASGQYGPRVDVPEDSTFTVKLMGFIGRHP